jgi:DNA-binding response OmpR family regulator
VIRKASPEVKLLFASGYTTDIITSKELAESGSDFIQKPFTPKALLTKMREVLDG